MKRILLILVGVILLGAGCSNQKDLIIQKQQEQIDRIISSLKEHPSSTEPTKESLPSVSKTITKSTPVPKPIVKTIEKVIEQIPTTTQPQTTTQPISQNNSSLVQFNNIYNDFVYSYSGALSNFESGLRIGSENPQSALSAKNFFSLSLTGFQSSKEQIKNFNNINLDKVSDLKNLLYLATDARIQASQHCINFSDALNSYNTATKLDEQKKYLDIWGQNFNFCIEKMKESDGYMVQAQNIFTRIK